MHESKSIGIWKGGITQITCIWYSSANKAHISWQTTFEWVFFSPITAVAIMVRIRIARIIPVAFDVSHCTWTVRLFLFIIYKSIFGAQIMWNALYRATSSAILIKAVRTYLAVFRRRMANTTNMTRAPTMRHPKSTITIGSTPDPACDPSKINK